MCFYYACLSAENFIYFSDKFRSRATASSDDRCTVLNQNLHMFCEILCIHVVNGITLLIDCRHARIRLGDDRNRYVLFDIADRNLLLIFFWIQLPELLFLIRHRHLNLRMVPAKSMHTCLTMMR